MYQIMTAGPVQVSERVRMARSLECTNPDIDPAFYDFYKETLLTETIICPSPVSPKYASLFWGHR